MTCLIPKICSMSVMFVRLLRLTTTTSEVIFVIQPLGGYKYRETIGFGFQNKFFNYKNVVKKNCIWKLYLPLPPHKQQRTLKSTFLGGNPVTLYEIQNLFVSPGRCCFSCRAFFRRTVLRVRIKGKITIIIIYLLVASV